MSTPITDAAIVPISCLTAFSEVVPAKVCRALEAKAARLDWRALAESIPGAADYDAAGEVEWSNGRDIWQGDASEFQALGATHWRAVHLPTP